MTDEVDSVQRMRDDFRLFLWYLWTHYLSLPEPTRVQYDIAVYLQHGPRKRFIQAFRGVGKSWITAAYVVWRLWNNPQLKVMIVSANEGKAKEIATFIFNLIQMVPELSELRPRDDQRNSVLSFDVGPAGASQDPSVNVKGITGQLTGGHADILLSDDVEVPKNSETETMRAKLEERTKEYAAIVKPDAETIYLGTPQNAESIYRHLPGKGYGVRVWPSRYPLKTHLEHYGAYLAPMLLKEVEADPSLMRAAGSTAGGAPTDPERFNELDLQERELEYRKAGYMLQFQLDTRLSDADKHPLKLRDLIVMDVHKDIAPVQVVWANGKELVLELPNLGFDGDRYYRPMYVAKDWLKYQGAVMFIDPSGRGKDETSYAVVKMMNGMLYLSAVGGFRTGYGDETLMALAKIAKEFTVTHIRVEDNFGDGMWTKLFSPVLHSVYPVTVEEVHSTGQKEKRILDVLEPVIENHRLVVDRAIIESDAKQDVDDPSYRLFHQLTHITTERGSLRHEDRLEALSGAVAYWVQQLGVDVKKAEQRHQDKKMDKAIREHLESQVLGRKVKKNRNVLFRY